MNIIASYAGTVFTGAVVLAAVIGAVRQILKDRKNGTLCTSCHCHGGCSGCGGKCGSSLRK
ncbi:FeoB-associated Cys-rich membrane protein [Treponema porcinum]|uniref:FeoB-associated Cys-rich membrane protein n=1 Tax=Treponema porcinum TaxID=261392 RepID=UPI0023536375|nr:FeoB-associated Cys-rich membrane protein [Treponema porcinum]MCI6721125.1 FeoB-associated Cys-rich membrane protein [Treponema porcinum]